MRRPVLSNIVIGAFMETFRIFGDKQDYLNGHQLFTSASETALKTMENEKYSITDGLRLSGSLVQC